MHWDGYTIFSVLSGICLLASAAAPRTPGKDRIYALIGGGFFAVYGFYVAGQVSGTYIFLIWIFIIPFALIADVLWKSSSRWKGDGNPPSIHQHLVDLGYLGSGQ